MSLEELLSQRMAGLEADLDFLRQVKELLARPPQPVPLRVPRAVVLPGRKRRSSVRAAGPKVARPPRRRVETAQNGHEALVLPADVPVHVGPVTATALGRLAGVVSPPSAAPEQPKPPPPSASPPPARSARATLSELLAANDKLGIQEKPVTEEQARDVFVKQKDEFTSQVLMDACDISRHTADEYFAKYCERGIITHTRGRGANARYTYVPPEPDAPRVRPRGAPKPARGSGAGPVAGTGMSKKKAADVARQRKSR